MATGSATLDYASAEQIRSKSVVGAFEAELEA